MPLFFGLGRPIEATVDIVALTGVTGYLAYTWGQVDLIAGWTLAPYLGWLSFATYLSVCTVSIYSLEITAISLVLTFNEQAGCGYLNNWGFSIVQTDKDV
jgi:benzodiazapine receptor